MPNLPAPDLGWDRQVPSMSVTTICIPAYKAERFLAEALDSVRRQTFQDWELIVTEDGSDDGTEGLVAEFAESVSQTVRFHRHEKNKGLPATRNSGIAEARGEWIALLDADDYWAAEHLADLMAKLAETKADVVHSGSILFDSDSGQTLEIRAPTADAVRDFPRSLFVADYIIQPASVVLSKALWTRVGGFDESFHHVEDREMWLRCARAGARFAFTGRNTCHYRRHAGALSTQAAEMAIAGARVFERHLDWAEIPQELRVRSAVDTWVAGARILQRAEPRRASELLLRAQRISPRFDRLLWVFALRLYSLFKGK